jgi:hypothetical protein
MRKANRVALHLIKLSDEALLIKIQSIIERMTNNANFPPPIPELDALQTAVMAYQSALVAQRTHPVKEATFHKNVMRVALEQAYRILGNVVELKSNNNLGTLLSSGFEVRKTATPKGCLEKPSDLQVTTTSKPGSVRVSVTKVSGASSYIFQYALSPLIEESQWKTIAGTSRSKIIDGLELGKQYAFRVGGIGADPVIIFSDTITRFIS